MLGYEPRAVGADLRRLLRHLPASSELACSGGLVRPWDAVSCSQIACSP